MVDERYATLMVVDVRDVADRIVLARLEGTGPGPVAPWEPGAHLEIRLPSGLIRHYSLCGDPTDTTGYEIAVLREHEGRGGSEEFHRGVRPGWEFGVGLPRNDFALERADDYLFLAGGVGITPILPMIRAADAAGASWRLVYGGRSRSSMAFLDEVLALGPDRVAIFAEDENGRPDLTVEVEAAGAGTHVYACGPGPMLDVVTERFRRGDLPAALHLERFGGVAVADVSGDSFEVVARRSGAVVSVGPDQTILAALQPVIPGLPFSCTEGYCGTCETTVVEGTPDHRDTVLDEEEREAGDIMMICVSRCLGARIVLDL